MKRKSQEQLDKWAEHEACQSLQQILQEQNLEECVDALLYALGLILVGFLLGCFCGC